MFEALESFSKNYQHTLQALSAISTLGAVLVSLYFACKASKGQTQSQAKSLAALKAEITICHTMASGFLKQSKPNSIEETIGESHIPSPSYRLPTILYSTVLYRLLSEGFLGHLEAEAIVKFYNVVESLNRGLDIVEDLRLKDTSSDTSWNKIYTLIRNEHERNLLKAKHLLEDDFYKAVIEVIDKKMEVK